MDNRKPLRICNLCFYHEDKSSRNFSRHATKIHGGITDYRIEYLDEDELQELRAKWALFKINRYRNVSPIDSTSTQASSSSSASIPISQSQSLSSSILSQYSKQHSGQHSRQSQQNHHHNHEQQQQQQNQNNHQDQLQHQILLQQQQQQQIIDQLSPHQLQRALKKQNSKYNVVNLLFNTRETNEAFFSQLINS